MKEYYPSLLQPTTTESVQIDATTLLIPKVELRLRRWQGLPVADDFGGKPLIDFAGRPVFAELAVYELCRLSGWEARWIETYGAPAKAPKYYTDWLPGLARASRTMQLHQPVEDEYVAKLLSRMMAANGQTFAGCWDVLGWHGTTLIFAECKRRHKDKLRATQPRWLAAGLQEGLKLENFLLVEWDFELPH